MKFLLELQKHSFDLKSSNEEVKKKLFSMGFVQIGDGGFGYVFKHSNLSYVLKIFSKEDKGYIAFYEVAKKHQDNPHFPKFRGGLITISEYLYAIRMEKLTPAGKIFNLVNYIDDVLLNRYVKNKNYWNNRYPKLNEALEILQDTLYNNNKIEADITEKNIMMRGSTPVITDPFTKVRLEESFQKFGYW